LISQRRIVVQVGRDDAQQVVRVAEEPLRVPDLRDGGDRGLEGRDGGGVPPLQRDADDGLEAEPDGGRVNDGAVAGDDAGPLELAQPPVAGRGRELHPIGQLRHRQAAVLLKLSKNLAVNIVHAYKIFHKFRFYTNISNNFSHLRQ
jgi:hypothetical protein